ncbi:FHA domain-containing protein, partial [Candidatus Woesearchaeota archaeon]|nr:FHA domain-containing protein [Candidatus Woesearchaeota archaeon]
IQEYGPLRQETALLGPDKVEDIEMNLQRLRGMEDAVERQKKSAEERREMIRQTGALLTKLAVIATSIKQDIKILENHRLRSDNQWKDRNFEQMLTEFKQIEADTLKLTSDLKALEHTVDAVDERQVDFDNMVYQHKQSEAIKAELEKQLIVQQAEKAALKAEADMKELEAAIDVLEQKIRERKTIIQELTVEVDRKYNEQQRLKALLEKARFRRQTFNEKGEVIEAEEGITPALLRSEQEYLDALKATTAEDVDVAVAANRLFRAYSEMADTFRAEGDALHLQLANAESWAEKMRFAAEENENLAEERKLIIEQAKAQLIAHREEIARLEKIEKQSRKDARKLRRVQKQRDKVMELLHAETLHLETAQSEAASAARRRDKVTRDLAEAENEIARIKEALTSAEQNAQAAAKSERQALEKRDAAVAALADTVHELKTQVERAEKVDRALREALAETDKEMRQAERDAERATRELAEIKESRVELEIFKKKLKDTEALRQMCILAHRHASEVVEARGVQIRELEEALEGLERRSEEIHAEQAALIALHEQRVARLTRENAELEKRYAEEKKAMEDSHELELQTLTKEEREKSKNMQLAFMRRIDALIKQKKDEVAAAKKDTAAAQSRMGDLIEEFTRYKDKKKKQIAETMEAVKAEIRRRDAQWQAEIDKREKELEAAAHWEDTLQGKINQLNLKLQASAEEIGKMQKGNRALVEELYNLESDIKAGRLVTKEELAAAESEIERIRAKLRKAEDIEIPLLQIAVENAREQAESEHQNYLTALEESQYKEELAERFKAYLEDAENEKRLLEGRLDNYSDQIDALGRDLLNSQAMIDNLTIQLRNLEREGTPEAAEHIESLKKEIARLVAQNKRLSDERAATVRKLNTAKGESEMLESKMAKLIPRMTALKQELTELRKVQEKPSFAQEAEVLESLVPVTEKLEKALNPKTSTQEAMEMIRLASTMLGEADSLAAGLEEKYAFIITYLHLIITTWDEMLKARADAALAAAEDELKRAEAAEAAAQAEPEPRPAPEEPQAEPEPEEPQIDVTPFGVYAAVIEPKATSKTSYRIEQEYSVLITKDDRILYPDGKTEMKAGTKLERRRRKVSHIVLPMEKDQVVFGRDAKCDVVFREVETQKASGPHPTGLAEFSRRFFVISRAQDRDDFYITCLSQNPIFVKGQIVPVGEKVKLTPGCTIMLDREAKYSFEFTTIIPAKQLKEDPDLGRQDRWERTTVTIIDMSPPKIEMRKETHGYLEVPQHARITESGNDTFIPGEPEEGIYIADVSRKLSRKIALNRDETVVGLVTWSMEEIHNPETGRKENARIIDRDSVTSNDLLISVPTDMQKMFSGKAVSAEENIARNNTRITRKGSQYFINNIGNKRTLVNLADVKGERELHDGDVIHFGDMEPIYVIFRHGDVETGPWKKKMVAFDHLKMHYPAQDRIGTLLFPKQVRAYKRSQSGEFTELPQQRIMLEKKQVYFGQNDRHDIFFELTSSDTAGSAFAQRIENPHFMIRWFVDRYFLLPLTKTDMRVLPPDGRSMELCKGESVPLADNSVIWFVSGPEGGAHILFRMDKYRKAEWLGWYQIALSLQLDKPGMSATVMQSTPTKQFGPKKSLLNRLLGK